MGAILPGRTPCRPPISAGPPRASPAAPAARFPEEDRHADVREGMRRVSLASVMGSWQKSPQGADDQPNYLIAANPELGDSLIVNTQGGSHDAGRRQRAQ